MTTDVPAPPTPSSPTPGLLLASTQDVLGAVPYLVGFHPSDSLVVIGLKGRPPRCRLHLTVRWDLPLAPPGPGRLLPLLAEEGITQVIVVGYGPGTLVTPAVDLAVGLFRRSGVTVVDALRAEDGRYWSYTCSRAGCCPADGTPYDRETGVVATKAIVHGLVALPDRQTLERSLDPVDGAARLAVRRATARVTRELRAALTGSDDPGGLAAEFVADGVARVRSAIALHASGGRLSDEEAVRLGFALAVVRIRDEAWALITDHAAAVPPSAPMSVPDACAGLWRDLTRRLEPRFVPPVASLLGAAAWCRGDSALAGIALSRACEIDPGYSMANLLMCALRHMLPPRVLRERMPGPQELDREMGAPRMAWLLPMIALLEEPEVSAE
ncbi:DUF4192 domain-containing protein [Streptosporangium sp. NPDC000239]|uniref:DUF4192 domain-containing protein n=1 Tax=Streptosporangium sp. NPDC000239 TaxID=3154248 RepID=UPI00331E5FF4